MGIDPDSHSSYVQAIGRVLRPATYADRTRKTHANIYDLTGCVDRHGRVELLEYTADDLEIPDIVQGEAPVKQCPDENCKLLSRIAAEFCLCGCSFDVNKQRVLIPDGDPFALLSGTERIQKAYYEEALLRAFEAGDRPIAARNDFYDRFNFYPPLSWRRNFNPSEQVRDWLLSDGAIDTRGDRQLLLELSHVS
jgi:superfamily II DNA or RNA helicase